MILYSPLVLASMVLELVLDGMGGICWYSLVLVVVVVIIIRVTGGVGGRGSGWNGSNGYHRMGRININRQFQ